MVSFSSFSPKVDKTDKENKLVLLKIYPDFFLIMKASTIKYLSQLLHSENRSYY